MNVDEGGDVGAGGAGKGEDRRTVGSPEAPDAQRLLARFERNLVLRASAGTGKTEALTSLYLHLLAGATADARPAAPSRIVALTFSERAAGEMRERIGRALEWVATHPDGTEGMPRAIANLAETIAPRELAPALDAARRDFGQARISTIHSFCLGLLREHAAPAGLDPRFAVADVRDARGWLEDAARGALLDAIRAGDRATEEWVQELGGLDASGPGGIVGHLCRLWDELAERGEAPAALLRGWLDGAPADGAEPRVRPAPWSRLLGAYEAATERKGLRHKTRDDVRESCARIRCSPEFEHGDGEALVRAALSLHSRFRTSTVAEDESVKAVHAEIVGAWVAPREEARARRLVALLEATAARYAGKKHARGALDFADLVTRARNLLRDDAALRCEVTRGIDALLVDEFQDTNKVQRDLVCLLRAKPETPVGVPEAAQLEPKGLFLVGDRKQAIYGFRSADVSVFEELSAAVVAAGGREASLVTSYRSNEPLVRVLNVLSEHALGRADDGAGDREALRARHGAPPDAPVCAEWIELDRTTSTIDAEARAVAAIVVARVAEQCHVRDSDNEWRPVQFGDIAVLLRRMTHVQRYARAFERAGVPYVVVGGRGLFGTTEARDLLTLGRMVLGRAGALDALAFLRGPWVGLGDGALEELTISARAREQTVGELLVSEDGGSVSEVAAWARARALVHTLLGAVERIGLRATFGRALSETLYPAVLRGLPAGVQRVANVERILGHVARAEAAGKAPHRILAELEALADANDEPEADLALEGENAVRVLTIHQAKGLQFPVVIAADLGYERRETSPIRYDRDPAAGLAIAVRGPGGVHCKSPRFAHVEATAQAREQAEERRLFYVQVTRARDRLVLVGRDAGLVRDVVRPAAQALVAEGLMTVRSGPVTAPAAVSVLGAPPVCDATVVSEAARLARPARGRARSLRLPVTQLEDFWLCPRRFRARHVLQIPEHPAGREVNLDADTPDPRRRGTEAHAVLERLRLEGLRDAPGRTLDEALATVPGSLREELRTRLSPFVEGRWLADAAASARAIGRETPFTLRVQAEDVDLFVHGQIDLALDQGGSVDVIDYKVTAARGRDPTFPYRFQLSVYAHAMRLASGVDVRPRVQFLDGRSAAPVDLELPLEHIPELLAELASRFEQARAENEFAGSPEEHCRAIECGYLGLCHPRPTPRYSVPHSG